MLLRASLIATVTVPILIWVYIWIYGMLTQKHTIASVDYDFAAGIDESNNKTETNTSNDSKEDYE